MNSKTKLLKIIVVVTIVASFICGSINYTFGATKLKLTPLKVDKVNKIYQDKYSIGILSFEKWKSHQDYLKKQAEIKRIKVIIAKRNRLTLKDVWLKNTEGSHLKYYEPYYLITNPNSDAYPFQQRSDVYEDSRGFLVQRYKGKIWYSVALGEWFGKIGTKYIITLSSGNKICVVKADEKAGKDTDSDNYCGQKGHILEFLINPHTSWMSDIGVEQVNFDRYDEFKGSIIKIQRVIK
jgi:hypothetical protein